MNIFVIDKATRQNLGILNFIPRIEEHIVLKESETENIECIVECVLYDPREHAVIIFVNIVEPYYTSLLKEVKWGKVLIVR